MRASLGLFFSLAWILQSFALHITSPTYGAIWPSSGSNAITWVRNSTDPLAFQIYLSQMNSSNTIILNRLIDSAIGEYIIDTVLPVGEGYYISFYDSNPDYLVISDVFFVVDGGPSAKVSVTVVNGTFISTIGGGVFSAPYEEPTASPTGPAPSLPPIITPVPSTIPTEPAEHRYLSTGATIGIGVSVAMVIVILIGVLVWHVFGRRRTREKLGDTDIFPLRKFPATKDSKPQEQGVPDGPPVEVWG